MARSRRRKDRPGPLGFLVVDKPVGWTSHDVVDAARRWFGVRRIGHLGTLDPRATGVLPLAVREATRLAPYLEDVEKHYSGGIALGVSTDTYDAEGRELYRYAGPLPGEAEVRAALATFVGEIEQLPPMYSAVKKDGVPLYKLARRGEEVERRVRRVTVHRLELRDYRPPRVGIDVVCSAGTYLRTLAQDLGERLGCGAHLSDLRRTKNGPFDLSMARLPEACAALAEAGALEAELLAPDRVLGFVRVMLTPAQARRVASGGDLAAADARSETTPDRPLRPGMRFSALSPGGAFLAVMELGADRRLRPLRVIGKL